MRQYTAQDGTVVTEGDGWCELDSSNTRSLPQIVQDIKTIVEKMQQAPIVLVNETLESLETINGED